MVHLLVGHGEILRRLGGVVPDVLLLLVQLVDDLVLAGDLVVQPPDRVVAVGLLLLHLRDRHVDVVDVLLHGDHLLLKNLLVGGGFLASSFFRSESVLGVLQFRFGSCNSGGGFGLLEIESSMKMQNICFFTKNTLSW